MSVPPGQSGYFFPAEWHPHRATWLSWPHNPDTWPGLFHQIFDSYLEFIHIITQGELVCINVNGPEMQHDVEQKLQQSNVDRARIQFYHHPTNDAWCRDHGPCFLIHPHHKKLIVDWGYNAWGEKYPPFDFDNAIPKRVALTLGLELVTPGIIMEGGSVEFNGAGTLMTTSTCLLNDNRNPHRSQEEIERMLREFYGVQQILWLHHGIAGDDTDGHIDDIARFINEDTVLAAVEQDPADDNYEPLQENLRLLRSFRLPDGRPLNVVPLPMPTPRFLEEQRLPASYANFYICNHAVIVPTFSDPNDAAALETIGRFVNHRAVIGVDSTKIIAGLGSFHCLSQQEPL